MLINFIANLMIGAALTSHAGLVAEQLDHHNFINGHSVCETCQCALLLTDMIPIISYLYLGGKCRYCKTAIPKKLFYLELAGALVYSQFDFSNWQNITTAALLFFLIICTLTDLETRQIALSCLITPTGLAILFPLIPLTDYTRLDWFNIALMGAVLIWLVLKQKLGSGDLLIFIILVGYLGPFKAISLLLLACLWFIGWFCVEANKKRACQVPFVPFLTLSFICLLVI